MNILWILATICAQIDELLRPLQDSLIVDAKENYPPNEEDATTANICMCLDYEDDHEMRGAREVVKMIQQKVSATWTKSVYATDKFNLCVDPHRVFMDMLDKHTLDRKPECDGTTNSVIDILNVLSFNDLNRIKDSDFLNRKKPITSIVSNIKEPNKIKEFVRSYAQPIFDALNNPKKNIYLFFSLVFSTVPIKKDFILKLKSSEYFKNPFSVLHVVEGITNIGTTISVYDNPYPDLGLICAQIAQLKVPKNYGYFGYTNFFVYRHKFGCFSIRKRNTEETFDIGVVDTKIYKPQHSYEIKLGPYNRIKTIFINLYEEITGNGNIIKVYIYKIIKISRQNGITKAKKYYDAHVSDIVNHVATPKSLYDPNKNEPMLDVHRTRALENLVGSSDVQLLLTPGPSLDLNYKLLNQFDYNPNIEASANDTKCDLFYGTDSSGQKKLSFFTNYLTNQNIYHKVKLYRLPVINAPELDSFYENVHSKIITRSISIFDYYTAIDADERKIKAINSNAERKNVKYLFDSYSGSNDLPFEHNAITFDYDFIYNCKILQTGCETENPSSLSNTLVIYNIKIGCNTVSIIVRYNFTNGILTNFSKLNDNFEGEHNNKGVILHENMLKQYMCSDTIKWSVKKFLAYFDFVNTIHMISALCLSDIYRRYMYEFVFLVEILNRLENYSTKKSIDRKYSINLTNIKDISKRLLSITYLKSMITILNDELGNVEIDYNNLDLLDLFYAEILQVILKIMPTDKISYTTHITVCGENKIPDSKFEAIVSILEA